MGFKRSDYPLLSDAMKDGRVTEESFIAYLPDCLSFVLPDYLTGFDMKQKFKNPLKPVYNPFIIERETRCLRTGVYLVLDGVLRDWPDAKWDETLALGGEEGYNNGREALDICAKSQNCDMLRSKGIAITEEFYYAMPDKLKYRGKAYWLATQCSKSQEGIFGYIDYGMKYVDGSGVHMKRMCSRYVPTLLGGESVHEPYRPEGHSWSDGKGVRTAVQLRPDTIVWLNDSEKDGSTPEKAIRLSRKW